MKQVLWSFIVTLLILEGNTRPQLLNSKSNVSQVTSSNSQTSKVVSVGIPIEVSIKETKDDTEQVTAATATLPMPPPQVLASVGSSVLNTSPGTLAAVGPAPIFPAFPGLMFPGTVAVTHGNPRARFPVPYGQTA